MKKILAIVLSIVMLLSIVPFGSLSVSAAGNGVQSKINEIAAKYPTGSYFSANGKACSHGQYETCSNCKLSSIAPSAVPTCIDAWTCLAFARYSFWYIFGLNPDAQSYQWATFSNINSIAKPGDFITFYSTSGYYHAAIYLGASANGFYAYTSNYTKANDVKYNRDYTPSNCSAVKFKVFHASNYDTINGSGNSSSSATNVTVLNTSEYKNNEYYETNAVLNGQINKPTSYPVTKLGIRIRETAGSYSDSSAKFYSHTPTGHSNKYIGEPTVYTWFDINAELNLKLVHNTSYTYQIYAQVNGKDYYSPEKTFSTTGSHSYGSWTISKKATCTVAGTKTRKCTGCSKIETQTIPAEHKFSEEFTIDTNATCGKNGSKSKHCLNCDEKTQVTDIPATNNHEYENDCDANCNVCEAVREVPEHVYTNNCDTSCNICDKIREVTHEISANYFANEADHWKSCTLCGEKINLSKHEYENDCDSNCNICGYLRNANQHVYTNSCDVECNVCKYVRAIEHDYIKATCTEPKTCKVCGKTSGRKLGHDYETEYKKATTEANGKSWKECTRCGKKKEESKIYKIKSVKLSTTEYTYNGKAKSPKVTVKDSKGNVIKDKYYTVTGTGKKNVGEYTVKVKFKTKYSGTVKVKYVINPKKSSVSSVTAATKSLKVKIKKVSSQATGYEIQYSTSKKFTSSTTKTKKITSYKTTSATIKSLKAKKTYYVRVRTYKTVDGKKYYSDWSSYKSKKTK